MNMLVDMTSLDGEIFEPERTVRFFLFPHALGSERQTYEVPAGLSVSEAIRHALHLHDNAYLDPKRFAFYLQDGTRVPENMWDNVRLKPNTNVVARPVAEAPIFAVFGAISAMMSAAGAFFASLGIFGQLLLSGITMAAKFLLAKLFAPKVPKPDKSDAAPIYSISGSRNQITQWGPIPLILGRHRFSPPLAASPYTETVGDEQYLRQVFCNGYGPLYLEEATAKIGETAVSSYLEAQIEHRYGYSAYEAPHSLYPGSVIDTPLSIELKQVDPVMLQTTATDAVQVALDFAWSGGLTNIDNKGKRRSRAVSISMQYRQYPYGGWIPMPTFYMEAATQKTIRRTVYFAFPQGAGQYEIMVHKDTAEPGPDLDKAGWIGVDTCNWTSIRSYRTGEPIRFHDAPISTTALRVRASGRINQTVDTYNIVAWSRVTAFNGSTWVANQPSRNPADLFRWVLQCGANRRPYPTSKIDLPALQNWWHYCNGKGWVYDKVLVQQVSVFDLLTEICAAGRAMPVFKDGKWSVVWDDQNVPISQLFTPRNSWNFEEQRDLDPIPHGYRIRFPNEDKGWNEDERMVYNDGYDKSNATLLEGFDCPGQTHTTRVWKMGRFHLAQRILRPGTYTLFTSWDALPLIRGDRVRVNYDTFKYGLYSGRVIAVDVANQAVMIDTSVLLAGGTNYMFRFRLNDGSFLTRTIDPGYVGNYITIGLVGTGSMPQEGNLFSLGVGESDSRVFRVVGIEPMEDLVHRLSLVADAPEIAYADIGQIPDYTEGINEPIDPYTLPPRNLRVSDGVYFDGGTQYWANLDVAWQPPAYGRTVSFEIQYRESNDPPDMWVSAGSVGSTVTNFTIQELDSGIYTVRVRAIFDDKRFSGWAVASPHATTEYDTPPADVDNFRIAVMGDMSILRWDPVLGVGMTYEIRYAASGVTAPSWNSAIPLLTVNTNVAQFGSRSGTFFIKARKPWGLTSMNAAIIVSDVGNFTAMNFVTMIKEDPDFPGIHEDTEIADYELRLKQLSDLTYTLSGTYYFGEMIDLGENIDSRISIFLDAYGFNPQTSMATWITLESVDPLDSIEKTDWTVVAEFRVTQEDPALDNWSDWMVLGLTDVRAWAMQFRLKLQGKIDMDTSTGVIRSLTTPSVQQLEVTIDMADRIEKGEDITAPAAGITVTYPDGSYRVVPAVVITPQNMVQGDYYKVTEKTKTSFKVQFWNVSNTAKSLTFDWMSKGWGRVR